MAEENATSKNGDTTSSIGLQGSFDKVQITPQVRDAASKFVSDLLANRSKDAAKQMLDYGSDTSNRLAKDFRAYSIIRPKDLENDSDGKKILAVMETLDSTMVKLNPSGINFSKTPRKFFANIFGSKIMSYWNRYTNLYPQLDENMNLFRDLIQRKDKDTELLQQRKLDFILVMKDQYKVILVAMAIDEELEKSLDGKPEEEQQFIQEQWLYPLRKRIMTLQEAYVAYYDFVLAAEVVVRGNRELLLDAREKVKVAEVALKNGIYLAHELHEQGFLIEGIETLSQTTTQMRAAVREMLGRNTEAIKTHANNTLVSVDEWQAGIQESIALFEGWRSFRRDSLGTLKAKNEELNVIVQAAIEETKKLEKADQAPRLDK